MTEIYQEGLRVPLIKLFEAGKIQQGIYDLILLNTRVPDERRGDLLRRLRRCAWVSVAFRRLWKGTAHRL